MLNEEDDFDVVGEAENERAALLLALELQPDVVLIDIFLGMANGLDIAKQLLRSCPDTHIVLYGGSSDEKLLFDALRIGVHGLLQKTICIDDLRRSLRAVQRGERVLGGSQATTQGAIEVGRLTQEQNRPIRGLILAEG